MPTGARLTYDLETHQTIVPGAPSPSKGKVMKRDLTASGAVLDDTGKYRYLLWRVWGTGGKFVTFIMLNPSVADAVVDDNTIKSCIRMAKSWGFDGLIVANLFAFRTKSPKILKQQSLPPIGPLNTMHILEAAELSQGNVVCAWGNDGDLWGQSFHVTQMLRLRGYGLKCIKVTKRKQPIHPLYQAPQVLQEYV
jgi:hypothetical protein